MDPERRKQMTKCDKLMLEILDTMIELNDYSDVEEVAKWLHCGTDKHLSVDELRMLKTDVKEALSGFIASKTGRSPMILPIIMEV